MSRSPHRSAHRPGVDDAAGDGGLHAARRHADRAEALDRRPGAGRGRRHHDVPGLAHHRRGHAGAKLGGRMAVRRRARGHHPGAAGATARTSTPKWRARSSSPARVPGVGEVRAYTKEESAGLLEPWLGSGLVARRSAGAADDRGEASVRRRRSRAAEEGRWPSKVAGASLDDHRAWIDRMRTMAQTTIAGGIGLLDPDAGRRPCCR